MDESYVSSDHSGYVRLPSPVNGGLDPNVLPLRNRGSLGEHQPIPIPSSLLQALEAKVTEKETHIRKLILDKDELSKKINDLEGRVDALEGDKLSLERQVKDTNCVKEIPKTHPLEEEEQTQSIEEEILGFRRQLDEENEHFNGVEMEKLSLQKRIAELEETRADQEKSKEDLESRIKLMQTLEKEICLFESRLADLEAARNEIASKDLQPHLHSRSVEEQLRIVNAQHWASTATMNRIQQTIFNTKLATWKVTNEMKSLKNGLDKATQESKASRIRMAQLSRATAEKIAKWAPLRHADDIKSRRQIAAFDNLLSEIDYTAMIREVHQEIIGS
ncbi:hypothetical protein B9Z19DRAFT_1122621 [Tuber borchii]|uniref:Uncharacterized protein n=1 Tax=Tuber borchii TaxID=42251 RepID=A0A2T7A042_TUBBO|nr:hypothetical protein B9Z19DRAFT_1122621 [Tuber borchii]